MKNTFNVSDITEIIERINRLTSSSQRSWGKMNVAQMLAHCNVVYEFIYTDKHSPPNFFMKLILKFCIKKGVVNEVPYKKNILTAPAFIMADDKQFEEEKKRLIDYINKTQELGKDYFENKESLSFGVLTSQEWNNMFYKHLDHHLSQFSC